MHDQARLLWAFVGAAATVWRRPAAFCAYTSGGDH